MSNVNRNGAVSSQTVSNHATINHSYTKLRSKIITTALYSRVFVVILAFAFDLVIPNHDADAFKWTPSSESGISSPTLIDRIISLFCDGLTKRYIEVKSIFLALFKILAHNLSLY